MPLPARALLTRTAAASWLALTLYETLRPLGWDTPVPFWAFFTESMAGVDYVQNVVLFLPLGWIACRARWGVRRAVLTGAVLSASIELAQVWVPHRTSTASDIICNTLGAALGWWMATRPRRPRWRLGFAFGALAAFMSLHQLNTTWPAPPLAIGGTGAWQVVDRVMCPEGTRESTACIAVPNTASGGNTYVRVVGANEATYARVQRSASGRVLGRTDCVMLSFESTLGAQLRLRQPLEAACGVADKSDRAILLQVDPRLEHERPGRWTPTRAGVWMWPVWPFTAYRPMQLVAAGAIAFVVLTALTMGAASWVIPAGYLAMLEIVALVAEMRAPSIWELRFTALAWALAAGCVALDRWWRQDAV